jgi:predicted exporter
VDALVSIVVRWSHRHRGLVVAAVLASLVFSLEGVRRLAFDADVLSLLPRDNVVIQSFRTFLARFGSLDQLYVVFTAPEGHAVSEYADDVAAWVEALRAAPEIARVDAGVVDPTRDFGWLADHQLLVLRGKPLDDALQRLTPAGMAAAVAARRDLLTVPSADVAELVRQDPAGLFDLLRDALGGSKSGINIGVSADGYVTPDGRSRLVIARPKRPPYDAEFSRALDARLHTIEASIAADAAARPRDKDEEPLPPMAVQFAGGHRIAVETEAVVRSETWWNTFGSLITILPLLWIVFRSLWLVGVGSLPSGLALVLVLGAIGFTGERLSAATTGAAAMLFGLGIDGVVLLYVAHRLAFAENPDRDAADAIGGPSSSMLLGMWTTAATFYGLMFVDFPSLQHLGRLLGHSMVMCGILTLVIVPAMLPKRPSVRGTAALVMPRLAAWIAARRRLILLSGLAATIALAAAATQMRVNPTLDRLRSVTPAAQLESTIGPAFGLPSDVYVVLAEGGDLEALLDTNERLSTRLSAEMPGLAFQPPTSLLPSAAAQQQVATEIERRHLTPDTVRASLERARIAGDFTPGAFDPFASRLPRLLDPTARITYEGYVAHGLRDLVDRFVVRNGAQWTLATYVFPTSAPETARVQRIVDQVDPSQRFTGLTLVNRELARSFLPQFVKGLVIGTVIVVALVIAAFRDWKLSLYAMLPTAIGLIWAAGVLAIAGVELDLFAVFAVVTFVGIGVDYGIHLVHRYQERGNAERATAELAPVILVAAAITMLGYGTLVTSSYPPLRSIGVVSAVSVVTLAAASVLVLPALLMTDRSVDARRAHDSAAVRAPHAGAEPSLGAGHDAAPRGRRAGP